MSTLELSTPPAPATYPVHVDAELDPDLSRGLWLVKWILAIPHYLVLALLWLAFAVTSVGAFFAILFTGRYPRSLFDFNVGVMRWTWRVAYYAYGALGTDRYPPFTLAEVPDYPAHLEVDYPEHLSRGLVLVKWWLLAIPHYLVIALFAGGVGFGLRGADEEPLVSISLIGVLVLVAGVALLFTGSYPRPVFDLVLGLNRWVLRVASYVALMTDRYPPFSLEQGGHETALRAGPPTTAPGAPVVPAAPAGVHGPVTGPSTAPHQSGWTAGRVVSLVVGSLLVITALGLGAGGAALAVADQTERDADGFLTSPVQTLDSDGFAIVSRDLTVHVEGAAAPLPADIFGEVRLVAEERGDVPLFVGVASTADAQAYLAGVGHATLLRFDDDAPVYRETAGGAPASAPSEQDIWVAQDTSLSGGSAATVTWTPENGDWTVVVMNADGTADVTTAVQAGLELPALGTVIAVALVSSAVLLVVGALLMAFPISAAGRQAR